MPRSLKQAGETRAMLVLIIIHQGLGSRLEYFTLGTIEEKALDPVKAYPTTTSSSMVRLAILKKCRDDIYHFLNHENGQIAIYDAVNPLAAGRRSLAKELAKHDVEVLRIGPCKTKRQGTHG
ncbi:MAG: hypothetical protein Q9168_000983 [Polycauliona sp. 1 TL-2023]